MKQEHAFKCYASTYNVEILNSFNPELQLKDRESEINSKLISSKQCCEERHADLLLMGEGEKKHVLIKEFQYIHV